MPFHSTILRKIGKQVLTGCYDHSSKKKKLAEMESYHKMTQSKAKSLRDNGSLINKVEWQ